MQQFIYYSVMTRAGKVRQVVRVYPEARTSRVLMSAIPSEEAESSAYFDQTMPLEGRYIQFRLIGFGNGSDVDLSGEFDKCMQYRRLLEKNSLRPKTPKDAAKQRAIALLQQGVSQRKVAAITGLSKSSVARLPHEFGLPGTYTLIAGPEALETAILLG